MKCAWCGKKFPWWWVLQLYVPTTCSDECFEKDLDREVETFRRRYLDR